MSCGSGTWVQDFLVVSGSGAQLRFKLDLSRFKYNYESSFLSQRHVVENLCWNFWIIYGGPGIDYRVVVPARQAT